MFFFFKQKTAYEMRISDWSSDVCSSDLRTRMTDDRLWLPFVACHYMDTTGDTEVLDTRQPFIEGPELEPGVHEAYYRPTTADTDASLYEHCARSEERRAGKEGVRTCRSRGSPFHLKNKHRRKAKS